MIVSFFIIFNDWNHIGDVASIAADLGFESRSGQTKYYKIGICGFSAALRRRRKSND
jgi:hypothetical protein